MTTPHPITPETRRISIRLPRPLWIGVAAAVLFVVAVGLRFGLPMYRQQVAIREIERVGGEVQTKNGGPNWLRTLVGDSAMGPFDEVRGVQFLTDSVVDADLAHIRSIREIEYLMVDSRNVTDAGLTYIDGMTCLQSLSLKDTKVTDVGLAHLKRLTRLQELDLTRTRVTGAGLAHLTPLLELQSLSLRNTGATDDGLAHLAGLTNMRELDLYNTQITDAGTKHLERMTRLTRLDLEETDVTAVGAAELNRALPNRPLNYFVPRTLRHSSDPFGVRGTP